MKSIKFIAPAILAGIMSFVMYSCSKSDPYTPPGGGGDTSTYRVNILSTQFDPATLNMLVGGKITWTNMDTEVHSIVTDNATSINSGDIAPGASFTLTPTVNGTYPYHCGKHPGVQGIFNAVSK